ncbi:MAG TPA: hypothetical protein VHX88_19365 [Solirubrobacteraceae bacterium]|nr:hypothetical protein [Solirubrobacteraceae bacterium]
MRLLTLNSNPCESPTSCPDGLTGWLLSDVRLAGPWVAVSAALNNPFSPTDVVVLWHPHGRQGPRILGRLTSGFDTFALVLRADGAAAYAHQSFTGAGTLDLPDACDSGCPTMRLISRYVEPLSYLGLKPLLTDVRFAANDELLWRDDGQLHSALVP